MQTGGVLCLDTRGFHRMSYYERGDAANPRIVMCVHGLTRNGRDFDDLAEVLAKDFRVICPDVAGRGLSDWLTAKTDYNYIQYMNDMTALIARVTSGPESTLCWVGTSMGALLGILLASLPRSPIAKLVANDAGPLVPKAALRRLASYVGRDERFDSLDALEAYMRRVSAPFGALTDAQWRHLTVTSSKRFEDGRWGMSYDPAIAFPLQGTLDDVDLWKQWDAVTCPTLVLRGAQSDVLLAETAKAMTERGPKAKLVEIPDVGHAPMLMNQHQIEIIRGFLVS